MFGVVCPSIRRFTPFRYLLSPLAVCVLGVQDNGASLRRHFPQVAHDRCLFAGTCRLPFAAIGRSDRDCPRGRPNRMRGESIDIGDQCLPRPTTFHVSYGFATCVDSAGSQVILLVYRIIFNLQQHQPLAAEGMDGADAITPYPFFYTFLSAARGCGAFHYQSR